MKTEKFKYGQEEREAEAAVKVRIEELVAACERDAGQEGREENNGEHVEAANDFLDGLLGQERGRERERGPGVNGKRGRDEESDGERRGGERNKPSFDGERRGGERNNPSYQKRFELMKRNEESRLRRLEKEADRRRDAAQERQRQVLADNEGVGDARIGRVGPLNERKAWRGTKACVERAKRRAEESAEDRELMGGGEEKWEREVGKREEKGAGEGEGKGEGEGDEEGQAVKRVKAEREGEEKRGVGSTQQHSSKTKKPSAAINFEEEDDDDDDDEDEDEAKPEDIARAAARAQSILQRTSLPHAILRNPPLASHSY